MQRPRVKVCGVTREKDVGLLDGRVDYVGFIVGARVSPRVVELERAVELASLVGSSTPVLVVHGVNRDIVVNAVARAGVFPLVQYHQPAGPGELSALSRELAGLGVRLAPVSLWDGGRLEPDPCTASTVVEDHEYLLVDAVKGLPPIPGGQGLRTPLSAVERALECTPKAGAAGGVRPENVCSLVGLGVFLVDVSSGVESSPGAKDPGLVDKLLEAVRGC